MKRGKKDHYGSQVRQEDLFCTDLPTSPLKNAGRILIAGASGYIGGRLVYELIARGYHVRVMVRSSASHYRGIWPKAEVVVADALSYRELREALRGVDTAYYLMHSLLLGPKHFYQADVKVAVNFKRAAEENGLKRIIYLGELGDVNGEQSEHLRNRLRVAEELSGGGVPITVLRAAVIIGSGSYSYEITQHVVKRLPVIFAPHWTNNRCQPIGIRDVIKYLVGCLETPETADRSFDIGGKDILTYREMMEELAKIINKKRLFIPVPLSGIGLYSYILGLITPVPAPLVRCLMDGLKSELICKNASIKELIPFEPLSYNEAVRRALIREGEDRVTTRWSDAYPKNYGLATKLHELSHRPRYITTYDIVTAKPQERLFRSICKIGGRGGWFRTNWMWRLRGIVDKMLLGVGTARGRKSSTVLKINDVVDFWRVEDIREKRRLLLRAEMKLPGRAWLEFNIEKMGTKSRLSVTAYYDTDTFFGKIYWYAFLPFHSIIFKDLIRQIESRG
jgi:uncharacterized protein YbjT (DUF2867 family)